MGKSIAYPLTPVNPHSHLRVVRDEEAPPYDGEPPTRAERGHVTVIVDTAIEQAFALGLAANGLYCYLERRVGKDGRWSSTLGDVAAACRQTVRHVRDAAKTLEEAGLIERETIYGRGGVPIGVTFFLPHHTQAQTPRTYDAEPTPEPTPEPRARVDKGVVTSNGIAADAKSKSDRRRPETPIPDDFDLSEERLSYAIGKGLDEQRAHRQFERFRNHADQSDRRLRNWDAGWRNWVLGDIDKNGVSPPTMNGHAGPIDEQVRRNTEAAKREMRRLDGLTS